MPQTKEPPNETNGRPQDELKRFEEIVSNAMSMRTEFFKRFLDPRRSIADECGHPTTSNFDANQFYDLYDREPIATRVVQLMPKESWQATPQVFEDSEAETSTPFEIAWDDLGRSLREGSYFQDEEGSAIWEYLYRVDEMSGIGSYGILLLGLNDGQRLDTPAAGAPPDGFPGQKDERQTVSPADIRGGLGTEEQYQGTQYDATFQPVGAKTKGPGKLLYLRVFAEHLAQITRYEADSANPRFGQPLMYQVTLNDPREQHSGIGLTQATLMVHWSRVIHVADNLFSEIFGVPRCRPVLNRLLDLQKLYGGSAEMYWRGAFPGISFETLPSMGGDVQVDQAGMRNQVENYMNGLQRYLALFGMTAKSLPTQVVDPTPQIDAQIQAICIQLACPKRVFMGSERGELASSQDDANWNDRLRFRQRNYISPRIIAPFIDRLILLGVLPKPKGYSIDWPDLDSLSDKDKADIASKTTHALSIYVQGSVESIVPPMEFLTKVLGMADEDADAILTASAKMIEDKGTTAGVSAQQLGKAGGVAGMLEMYQAVQSGIISDDQFKQMAMLFYKIDEQDADDLVASMPPKPEPPPMPPTVPPVPPIPKVPKIPMAGKAVGGAAAGAPPPASTQGN